MKHPFLFFIFVYFISGSVFGADPNTGSATSDRFHYLPAVKTIFPIFLGAGISFEFNEHFEINLLYGITPKPYSDVIGSTAANLGDNIAYKDVIGSAFQNNSLWLAGLKYNFTHMRSGWHIEMSYAKLSASGKAGIDSVLSAATGLDYTQLKDALTAAGKSTQIDMATALSMGCIQIGYNWNIPGNITLGMSLGITKVLNSEVELKTGLANFETTKAGRTLMTTSENELESIISQYGITPTLGITSAYIF